MLTMHADSKGRRPKLLVMASMFPRWDNDHQPRFVLDLSEKLCDAFDVHVLAPHAAGAKTDEFFGPVRVLRFRYAPSRFETLACTGGILSRLRENCLRIFLVPLLIVGELIATCRLLRNEEFAAIHAHWIVPQGLVAVLARAITRSSAPILCTSHGGDLYALKSAPLRWLKRWTLERCDAVTVVSEPMREEACRLGLRPDKVHVASMGAELTNTFYPRPEVEREPLKLLFVGRLAEKKGINHLITALPGILAKHPKARLVIAGEGPEEPMLRALVVRYELENKVEFAGSQPHAAIADLYRTAALAVFPFVIARGGDQEGLPLVMVEAMACKCPVIVSELPATREVVVPEKTGLLVQPGSSAEIAGAVSRLLDDSTLCHSLADAGYEYVTTAFDWQHVSERYSTLLHRMIQKRAGRSRGTRHA
jgi:glycosyltransferase involved in cell wall biosynthesis